jgi:predicted ribosome quality control (RQC) complex YloA/Tae2 family protein
MGTSKATAIIHPRRHTLSGGWIVLVGRSNRENDVLTHRIARQHDLWLHARGVAGSHVILQREGHREKPGKPIIEQAAAIAAYYSKARTSSMVPVVYTEKRYVRKPRKAAPGLAVCIREKVVLVEPRLPREE